MLISFGYINESMKYNYSFCCSPKVSTKSSSGKRLGRPPKKGTHLPVNSLGHLASASAANATSSETNARKRSPHSSPERDSEEIKKRRKRSPSKR